MGFYVFVTKYTPPTGYPEIFYNVFNKVFLKLGYQH